MVDSVSVLAFGYESGIFCHLPLPNGAIFMRILLKNRLKRGFSDLDGKVPLQMWLLIVIVHHPSQLLCCLSFLTMSVRNYFF